MSQQAQNIRKFLDETKPRSDDDENFMAKWKSMQRNSLVMNVKLDRSESRPTLASSSSDRRQSKPTTRRRSTLKRPSKLLRARDSIDPNGLREVEFKEKNGEESTDRSSVKFEQQQRLRNRVNEKVGQIRVVHERRALLREVFARAVTRLRIIVRMIIIHSLSAKRIARVRVSNRSPTVTSMSTSHSSSKAVEEEQQEQQLCFDKSYFTKPKELLFSDEAKRYLSMAPDERTNENIRYIMLTLNFSVPEFNQFPKFMQTNFARFAHYEEHEPGRVVIRQGHAPQNYYMIISGIGHVVMASEELINGELVFHPVSYLKRGDCFGDTALINNTRRTATVTVYGDRMLCLLVLGKEDFFRIQTPLSTNEEKRKFMESSVSLFKAIDYPSEILANNSKYCFTIFYRSGTVVCEDSTKSDWLFIIKSGSGKVFKRMYVNKRSRKLYDICLNRKGIWKDVYMCEALINYYLGKREQMTSLNYKNIDKLLMTIETDKTLVNDTYEDDDDVMKRVYLTRSLGTKKCAFFEMSKLKVGQIFGIHNVAFEGAAVPNSLMLVSEGLECVLVNKAYFVNTMPSNAMLKLKYALQPYPDEYELINKYYRKLDWQKLKKTLI